MVRYTSLAVFLLYAIALVIPSGFSLGALMLVLGSFALLKYRRTWHTSRQDKLMVAAFLIYFAATAILNLLHQAPGREYDAAIRFVLAAISLPLLLRFPPKPAAIWSGLAIGGIGAGIYAIWQVFGLGMERAEGTTNAIQYGNISLILGTLSLVGLGLVWQQRCRLGLALMGAGSFLGIFGALLTGSRGSWLALPVCIVILATYIVNKIPVRTLLGSFAGLILVLVALYQIPQTGIKARLGLVDKEVSGFVESGNSSTSIGTRLEMWRAGAMMFPAHPIIGWGKAGYMAEAKRLVDQGTVGMTLAEHSHLHNEYVDAAVKRGIVGLLSVLVLYLVPLYLFTRQLRHASKAGAPYAIAGILLYASYIMFGLTQAFLTHNNGVMILAFTTMILWALARQDDTANTHF